jgi:hypothetical protein
MEAERAPQQEYARLNPAYRYGVPAAIIIGGAQGVFYTDKQGIGHKGFQPVGVCALQSQQRVELQRHERLPEHHDHVQHLACGFPALEPIMNAKDE